MNSIKKLYFLTLLLPCLATTAAWLTPQPAYASPVQSGIGQFAVGSDCKAENLDSNNCGIIKYLLIFINVLSGLVGVVVVGMIVIGGIQYSAAGDDPQKVQEAKKRVSNAVLALLAYIFMYAFLQWVVPGGVF